MRAARGNVYAALAFLVAMLLAGIDRPVLLAGQPATAAAPRPFTMALTGDSIITRRLSVYTEPDYVRLIDLVRGADVAFTNLEMLFHDFEPYPMPPIVASATYMRAEPALARELVWAGFDMVARANNHAGDFGVEGMRLTTRHVQDAGLVQAGVGESLAEAREAKFLETARGRVALVSVASTFEMHSMASRSRDDVRPRPGLNPLRFTTRYIVTRERLETLRTVLKELGQSVPAAGDELRLLGNTFAAGDAPGVETRARAEDVEEIRSVVANASRLADYTIVTVHTHEAGANRSVPAGFIADFARAMIDAGADVFVGHGPHVLRGIEIYKGKPILYSLGNFIFQNETVLRQPSEAYEPYGLPDTAHVADFNDRRFDFDRRSFPAQPDYWQSVVAVPVWNGRALTELRLYPITLGFGQPRTVRGRPLLADPALGRKIIEDLTKMSQPFGTVVKFEDGIGKVVPTS